MISKFWKAFKAWHNAVPAPIEMTFVTKCKRIVGDDLGEQFKVVEQPKKPKPRIYWTFYPSTNRGFWRVSSMPKGSWHDPETKKLWDEAHKKAHELNVKIGKRK